MQKSDSFISTITNHTEQNEHESIKRMRKRAFEKFLDLGLPSRKNEAYRYMELTSCYDDGFSQPKPCAMDHDDIAPYVLPECKHSHVVFVNGHFVPALSEVSAIHSYLQVLSTQDAWRGYSALLKNTMDKMVKTSTNPFACFNASHHGEGLFLYLGPKCVQDAPVQIVSIIRDGGWIMPRVHLFAGASSEISLVHTKHVETSSKHIYNAAFDFALEDNAHVRFEELTVSSEASFTSFEAIDASVKRHASFCHTFVDKSANSRRDIKTDLLGEGADVQLSGMWALSKSENVHTNVQVSHLVPHCTSMQQYKGVLSGKAKSSFQGKIYVQKEAQKTESYQRNNNLLLSDEAKAYSLPNLEIFADDVKASHGATVAALEEEPLFYMKSRGISESLAKTFLVKGFCEEVVAKLSMPLLQEKAIESLSETLDS